MSGPGSGPVRARAQARRADSVTLRALAASVALGTSMLAAPAALAASACTCGFANGKFTLTTITIDGTLADWNTVKSDTDNNVCDAASVTAPTELGGVDGIADAPAQVSRDLTWFSFTWDATNVYFFTERAGGASPIQRFVYYGDTNNDGKMASGEPAVEVSWQGSNRNVIVAVGSYVQSVGGGDSLADTSGVADGYTMPGTIPSNTVLRNGTWGAADGLTMEFHVSWAELGLAGPRAVRFHVSSMNSSFNSGNPPGGVEDNMAGCGGGTGSTQFADVSVTTPLVILEPHSTKVCALATVTNLGNADDVFDLSNSIGAFSGAGGGTPTIEYYFDTNANSVYDAGTDLALTDTDADTTLDTGTITPLANKKVWICSTTTSVDSSTPSGSATVTSTFTSSFNLLVNAANTTTVTILLLPAPLVVKTSTAYSDPTNSTTNPKRIPGGLVTYTITATNLGGGSMDSGSIVLTDPIPANTSLYVSSLGGSPANSPVTQANGAVACGLALSFTALNNGADGLDFSNDNGTTWTYSPTADVNGVDAAVTNLRIKPTGSFAGASAAGQPSCIWTFRTRVK